MKNEITGKIVRRVAVRNKISNKLKDRQKCGTMEWTPIHTERLGQKWLAWWRNLGSITKEPDGVRKETISILDHYDKFSRKPNRWTVRPLEFLDDYRVRLAGGGRWQPVGRPQGAQCRIHVGRHSLKLNILGRGKWTEIMVKTFKGIERIMTGRFTFVTITRVCILQGGI